MITETAPVHETPTPDPFKQAAAEAIRCSQRCADLLAHMLSQAKPNSHEQSLIASSLSSAQGLRDRLRCLA